MNWKQENNKLVKTFQFNSQEKLAHFFLEVAKLSDKLDHHADARIYNCSLIEFSIYTHTSQHLTSKDFQLAEAIDSCAMLY
jgi:4a-hydroxytetrahydrobiopterin dehydratase